MKARLLPVVMIPLLVLVFSAWAIAGTANGKPKLVLQITIDQMRGDFPMRYKDRLGETGQNPSDNLDTLRREPII